MYSSVFGLRKPPFQITPDTQLFFSGSDRGPALQALCYAVQHGEGITKVVGEVGSGKTMLCRMLPLTLRDGFDWVYLPHPSLSPKHILHAIALELGLAVNDSADKFFVMRAIQQHLLQRFSEQRRVVVLIEEAQGMPLETLEEIRLLSNLETDEHKLLQIVLFGQPELDQNLEDRSIRQLRERIIHSLYLHPLGAEDICQYLNFRMKAAGYDGPSIFSLEVAKVVSRYSKGLIRRINILADKLLLIAFTRDRYYVGAADVHVAARDSQLEKSWGFGCWIRSCWLKLFATKGRNAKVGATKISGGVS